MNILVNSFTFALYLGFALKFSYVDMDCTGIWGSKSKLLEGVLEDSFSVSSPDKKSKIVSNLEGVFYVDSNGKYLLKDVIGFSGLTEVIWSNDSSYFAINFSDGGQIGSWSTHLFHIKDDGTMLETRMNNFILNNIGNASYCYEQEVPNIAILEVDLDSKIIKSVVEAPPHSSCQNMGEVFWMEINIHNFADFNIRQIDYVKENWRGSLGCRLIER